MAENTGTEYNPLPLKALEKLWNIVKHDKKLIGYVYVYAALAGLVSLTLPIGVQAIITLVNAGRISASFFVLMGLILFGVIAGGLLKYLQFAIDEVIQQKLFANAAYDISNRLSYIKGDLLYKLNLTELLNRFFEISAIQKNLSKFLTSYSADFLTLIFGILLLSLYHPLFVALSIVLLLVSGFVLALTAKRGLKTSLKASKYKYQVVHWFEEIANNIHAVKYYTSFEDILRKTNEIAENYTGARKRHFRILMIQYFTLIVVKILLVIAVLGVGGFLVIEGTINLGQFVAAEILILQVIYSVEKIILGFDAMYDLFTAVIKITDLNRIEIEDADTTLGNDKKLLALNNCIVLRELTYKSPYTDKNLLDKINLTINQGETVLISGATNSGTEELMNIMTGVVRSYEGFLHVGDVKKSAHNSVAYMPESRFEDNIFEILSLKYSDFIVPANEKISKRIFKEEEFDIIKRASETDALLGSGLLQKVILFKAMTSPSDLLIACLQLDYFTPREKDDIYKLITDKGLKRTTILFCNSENLLKNAERVVIMDKGKIIFDGKYDNFGRTY